MYQEQRLNNMQGQTHQQNDSNVLRERHINSFQDEQNPNTMNESFQMRKAIRTYFDSQPFSTIHGDKPKGMQTSCSNSYSGENSDVITTYSQNHKQYAHESDLDSDSTYQQPMKHIQDIHQIDTSYPQTTTQDQQYVAKTCYLALQKAYYDLQQKYFSVREEIKENQNQLYSLLTELRSQCSNNNNNNQQNSNYSQFSDFSMSSKLEEKFTSQINRAFRIMYENLKEESEKTNEQKETEIKELLSENVRLQKMNEMLTQQNEQKESALIDIVQYYGILKELIEMIKQEKHQSLAVNQVNQVGDRCLQQNNFSDNNSFTSISSTKKVDSRKKADILSSNANTKIDHPHLNSGFSFAHGNSQFQQDNEKAKIEPESNKENSSSLPISQDPTQSIKNRQFIITEYETFKTDDNNSNNNNSNKLSIFQQKQYQQVSQQIQYQQQQNEMSMKSQNNQNQQRLQNENKISCQQRVNSQQETITNVDDQSETVFEDVQAQSAYDWQFTSNSQQLQQQQIQQLKLPQFGEENYVSNDVLPSSMGLNQNGVQKDFNKMVQQQQSNTPNKSFRQLNDYLQTHESNFEQEQEEIDIINQKIKKSNRLNMMAKLKKEVFEEGLKSALNPTSIQTSRKGGHTTPRQLGTQRNSRVSDVMSSTLRSRTTNNQSSFKQQSNINEIDDPIQRGFMIIEDLYHSIDRRFNHIQN